MTGLIKSWAEELREYRTVAHAEAAYDRDTWGPANGAGTASAEVEDRMEQLQEKRCLVEDRLIQEVLAPDAAAVLEKLNIAVRRCEGFGLFDRYVAALQADLGRLAELEAAKDAERDLWDRTLARYQAAKLISSASEAWGPHHLANDDYEREQASVCDVRLPAAFRAALAANTKKAAKWEAFFTRFRAVEEFLNTAIYRPMWAAELDLARCPAPDMDALRIKLDIIKDDEVWNGEDVDGECWEAVLADVERLTGYTIDREALAAVPSLEGLAA